MESNGLFYVLRRTVYYAPNPGYDAYWVGGQWVFGTATTGSTHSGSYYDYITVAANKRPMVCGTPCPKVYRRLKGQVCVQEVNNVYSATYDGTWRGSLKKGMVDWRLGGVMDRNYDYLRNYASYCDFLDMQCRLKIFHDMGMIFVHMGPCLRDEEMFHPLYFGQNVKNYKLQALEKYRNQITRKYAGNNDSDSCKCHGRRLPNFATRWRH